MFWIAVGAFIGGLCGGVLALFTWMLFAWPAGGAVFALWAAATPSAVGASIGASVGAIGGLVAGNVARAAGATGRDVLDAVIEAGFTSGISAAFSTTVSALFNPMWAVAVAVLLGPSVMFFWKLIPAWTKVFERKTAPIVIIFARAVAGWAVGWVVGFLSASLLWAASALNLLPAGTEALVADVVAIVGPTIGAFAGLLAAIGSSVTGGGTRRAVRFAAEASGAAAVTAALGAALILVAPTFLGIGVAVSGATLWSVIRGRHIRPKR